MVSEDCGGPWGYAHQLSTLNDPDNLDYEDMKDILGDDFEPDSFDMEAINKQLARFGKPRRS